MPIPSSHIRLPHKTTPLRSLGFLVPTIYAATALGHIWLIDSWQDTQLMCWQQIDLDLMPPTNVWRIQHSAYHGQPAGCSSLSFSPDRSRLAWVDHEGHNYTAVSFGAAEATDNEILGRHGPVLQPQTHHSKACRHVPLRS